jgi:hypothetical protein
MRYKEILLAAYKITIQNPLLWLFGIVLLGGFNLSLINFFALVPGENLQTWPTTINTLASSTPYTWVAVIFAAAVLFVVLNFVKVLFIVVSHSLLHNHNQDCVLCQRMRNQSNQNLHQTAPYFTWLVQIILASAVTIVITVGITVAANIIINQYGANNPAVAITYVIFVGIIACAVGTWNAFTSYFIVIHGLNFKKAAFSSIDFILMRPRQVLEFVVILSVIYSLAVVVGNAFINIWHNGFAGILVQELRLASLIVLAVWLAVNNAFFNLAFIIFFDRGIKATPVETETELPVLAP